MTNVNPVTPTCENLQVLPWPGVNKYFKVVNVLAKNFKVQCLLCIPTYCTFSTAKNSSSNLKRHIKVCTYMNYDGL